MPDGWAKDLEMCLALWTRLMCPARACEEEHMAGQYMHLIWLIQVGWALALAVCMADKCEMSDLKAESPASCTAGFQDEDCKRSWNAEDKKSCKVKAPILVELALSHSRSLTIREYQLSL